MLKHEETRFTQQGQKSKKYLRRILIIIIIVGCASVICYSVKPINLNSTNQNEPEILVQELDQPDSGDDLYTQARNTLVDKYIAARGIENEQVLSAMRTIPRHEFVPDELIDMAYEDHALPIGYGQTISQPYVVAWMTDVLDLKDGDKVLEIGTGSGYQAAVLAEMGNLEIYTIEIIPELAESARARLEKSGYTNIQLIQGDGYYGWKEYAPYDAIIVTAAPDHLPQPLIEQLNPDGKLVIPIGPPGFMQTLWMFYKDKDGELVGENLGEVIFVPFTGAGIEND